MSSPEPQTGPAYFYSGRVYSSNPELEPLQPRPQIYVHTHRKRILIRVFLFLLAVWVTIRYIHPALWSIFHGDSSRSEDTRIVLPTDVQVKDCLGWTSVEKRRDDIVATTSLDIPVNSERLFFLREGTPLVGSFKVLQGSKVEDRIRIEVVLTAGIDHDEAIEKTRACYLGRNGGGDGVGVMADFERRWNHIQPTLNITVTLPRARSSDRKLNLKVFETDLPLIRQVLASNGNIHFERLELQSRAASIDAQDVSALQAAFKTTDSSITGVVDAPQGVSISTKNGQISGRFASDKSVSAQTLNGAIDGYFSSSGSVVLTTSNAKIDAAVDLFHDGVAEKGTALEMETSNGSIEGTINAMSLAPNTFGGKFTISSKTHNGKNVLKFPSIPPQSHVDVTTSTTNSLLSVELHEAWEGDYQVEVGRRDTAEISVRGNSKVEDPEGRGRQRHGVSSTVQRGIYQGRVWWGEGGEGNGKGRIQMQTSSGKAKLVL